MSQRSVNVEEEFSVDLKLNVKLKSFSNHNGFSAGQVDKAIEEFKEEIKERLGNIVKGEYYNDELLLTVDFVTYKVE